MPGTSAERRCPLLGPAQVEALLACRDHCAVDETGDGRRHLTGRHGNHHLVELGCPSIVVTLQEQRLPAAETGERDQVRVPALAPDLTRPVEGDVRALGVTTQHGLQRNGHQQVAAFGALSRMFVEHALGPGQPSAGRGHLALQEVLERQPERRPSGALGLALCEAGVVRPRPHRRRISLPATEVGGCGQALLVVQPERVLQVGNCQLVGGSSPSVARVCLTTSIQCVGHGTRFVRPHPDV
ncbi:MAG: hypothetical protein M3508_05885 [Actinomycetota bacterium]|nr:hypothetical protein [Actinomycetota bacterium]